MAGQTLTTASDVLKTVYLPRFREQLLDDVSPAYSQIEKSKENIQSLNVTFGIRTGRSVGNGSRVEYADLPTAGRQKAAKVTTGLKYHYAEVSFTGQVMRQAKADIGSFVTVATDEMERIQVDAKQVASRQMWNDSEGSLATVDSISGQDITLLAPTRAQLRSFVLDMPVDIGTSGSATAGADSVTVSAVNTTTGVITVVGTITSVVNGHFIRMEDSYGAEVTGLQQIVNSGDSVFGLDGATEPIWNSYVDHNSGTDRAPTEALLMEAIDEIAIQAGGRIPNLMVAPHDVVRAYGAQLLSTKRFNDTLELKGGHSGLTVTSGAATMGFVPDRFTPDNEIYMLNTNHLTYNTAADWEWMEEDGAVLERVPNKDAYHATLFCYNELTTDSRNAHGVLRDISGA